MLIASTFVIETGSGMSVINLRDNIVSKISNIELQLRLNEIIYKTIGNDYEKLGELFFDYQLASDSLSFYKALDVPRILIETIPLQVTNVTFESDLTSVQTIIEKGYEDLELSLLYKSLGDE